MNTSHPIGVAKTNDIKVALPFLNRFSVSFVVMPRWSAFSRIKSSNWSAPGKVFFADFMDFSAGITADEGN